METPEPERIILICCGRRGMTGNKLGYKYQIEGSEETMLFGKKIGTYGSVGVRLEVTKTDTGVQSPYKPLGFTKDADFINKHQLRDRAAYDEHETHKMLAKKQTTAYDRAIETLNQAYLDVSYSQRQAFLNRIIVEITKR